MTQWRYIRKREYALAALTLSLALFAAFGGDVPEDRVLQPLPMPYIAPVLGLQRYEDCTSTLRGQKRRFQVAHKSDTSPVRIECAYGPSYPRGGI